MMITEYLPVSKSTLIQRAAGHNLAGRSYDNKALTLTNPAATLDNVPPPLALMLHPTAKRPHLQSGQ